MQKPNFHLEIFEELPSTSAILLSRAGERSFHGSVIAARRQTKGVGRRGRSWVTGDGNLALSLGLHVESMELLPWFPLWMGIAAFDAVAKYMPLEPLKDFTLKWPNDLYWRKRKLAGILSQARQQGGHVSVAIGIGLNLQSTPELPDQTQAAVSLKEIAGTAPTVDEFAARLIEMLDKHFVLLESIPTLKAEWELRAKFLGQEISYGTLEAPETMITAQALELGTNATLLVRTSAGTNKELFSDDVSLRF